MEWLAPPTAYDPPSLRAAGREARRAAPRADHRRMPSTPRDPVAVLRADDATRLAKLLPVRYGRMSVSPFAFYRGAAALMAHDLAELPISGIRVWCCGDAHLMNFGGYATPERRVVFDVNDFDESAPGAWEWDVKRLAASIVVAGRTIGLRRSQIGDALAGCLASYRLHAGEYAEMTTLEIWYHRIDERILAEAIRVAAAKAVPPVATSSHAFPKIAPDEAGVLRFVEAPPHIFHDADDPTQARIGTAIATYARSLTFDRRDLFERFRFSDAAYKIVGVGSIGTRCFAALFVNGNEDRLFLQVKEARASVLEPLSGRPPFAHHGERVVVGQHLLQFASDLFLGWLSSEDGHDFYVRQLRDVKTAAEVERMDAIEFARYASLCAWALARAHARGSGMAPAITGYLGRGGAFDDALARFAQDYADLNERDYETFLGAIDRGEVPVERGV